MKKKEFKSKEEANNSIKDWIESKLTEKDDLSDRDRAEAVGIVMKHLKPFEKEINNFTIREMSPTTFGIKTSHDIKNIVSITYNEFSITYEQEQKLFRSVRNMDTKKYKFLIPDVIVGVYGVYTMIIKCIYQSKYKNSIKEEANPVVESTAKNILSKSMGRREFGKYVHETVSDWKNGKLIVGYYDGFDKVDPSDKNAVRQFYAEQAEFVNDLNSRLHIKGYHFNTCDENATVLDGNIYIGKDQNYVEQVVDSDNRLADHNYIGEGAYMAYLTNKAVLQNKTRRMVKEALILTDDTIPVNEAVDQLIALNENAITDGWDKFKNFLMKMWKKFGEFFNRMLSADKTYLEKYKDIILNKEFNLQDVKMAGDYAKGIDRISNFTVWKISKQEIEGLPAEAEAAEKQVQLRMLREYAGSTGVEFKSFCKSHFKGGDQEVAYTGNNPNLSEMYNFVYNYQKVYDSIQKDLNEMNNAGTEFINMAQTYDTNAKAQQNQNTGKNEQPTTAKQGAEGGEAQGATAPGTPGNPVKKKATETTTINGSQGGAKNKAEHLKYADDLAKTNPATADAIRKKVAEIYESTVYTEVLGNIVLEADGVTIGKGNAGANTGGGSTTVNNANAFNNQGPNKTAIRTANDQKSTGADYAAQYGNNEKAMEDLRVKVQAYTNTSTAIFSSMLTAAELIEKSYMTIIKAHVQSYLGKEDTTNNTLTQAVQNRTPNAKLNWTKEELDRRKAEIKEIKDLKAANNPEGATREAKFLQDASNATGKNERDMPNISYTTLDQVEADIDALLTQINAQAQQQQNQQGNG